VDAGALADRFEKVKAQLAESKWAEAEMSCSEILILGKSLAAITSASMKAGARAGDGKLPESMRTELSRLVSNEVTNRVEAVARTLPTASALDDVVQTKIQEALVTGGLIDRIESIAMSKAQAAVAAIPRFTAKDAQSAANLVVQRSLTQFLASKELSTRMRSVVEAELGKAAAEMEKSLTKSLDALLETRVASATAPLPTNESMEQAINEGLSRFVKTEPFEEKVLALATERARAEVQRAPEMMQEAAGRLARQEAAALFKTQMRSPEFVEQVKSFAAVASQEAIETVTGRLTELNNSVDARVAEKLKAVEAKLAEVSGSVEAGMGEKLKAVEAKLAEVSGSVEAGLAEKLKAVEEKSAARLTEEIARSRGELMTSKDFSDWLKDGALAALTDAGFDARLAEIEKASVNEGRIAKVAKQEAEEAALAVLDSKEFKRRIADLMDDRVIRSKIEEIGGGVTPEQLEQTADLQARNVFAEQIDSAEFAEKVKAVAGSGGAEESAKKLMARMEKIEKDALPQLVEKLVAEKATAQLGAASPEAIQARVEESVQHSLAAKINPQALQQHVMQIAQGEIAKIANTPEFKAMLDGKFKLLTDYLAQEFIPKQIRKLMGGG